MPRGVPRAGKRKPIEHKQYWYVPRGDPTPNTAQSRACTWCGKQYAKVQYGRRSVCSEACRKAKTRDTVLKAKYGITLEDYKALWDKQDGRCALCRRKSKISLAVEHSHITGTIRGLCCMTCNRDIIGPLDGNIEKLQAAIDFLQFARDDLAAHLPEPRLPEAPPVAPSRRPLVRLPIAGTVGRG